MSSTFETLSGALLVLLLAGIPVYGMVKGVKVYAAFVEGAREGFEVAVRIIPYLVAVLAAVGAFRGAGGMDLLARVLSPLTGPHHADGAILVQAQQLGEAELQAGGDALGHLEGRAGLAPLHLGEHGSAHPGALGQVA